jgi:hypothetical protein
MEASLRGKCMFSFYLMHEYLGVPKFFVCVSLQKLLAIELLRAEVRLFQLQAVSLSPIKLQQRFG